MAPETWARRLRDEREARGWSRATAARHLIEENPNYVAGLDEDKVTGYVKRWETGGIKGYPEVANQKAIAGMFGTAQKAFFPDHVAPHIPALERMSDGSTLELIGRLRSSSVDSVTLDLARTTLEQLCMDYASEPGPVVLAKAQGWLGRLVGLEGLNLAQRREVHGLVGWLALLISCLQHDGGNERDAEAMRRGALELGKDVGSSGILGWGAEIKAWMALTRGDYRAVIGAAHEGLATSAAQPVAVQLYAQQAKAWARLGDRGEVDRALDKGRHLLDAMPYPDNPRNHFQIDPPKFDFYAMDCYRAIGDNGRALAMAEVVVRTCTTPAGLVISPMRVAEAELTQALVAARAGSVDTALTQASAALTRGRRSLPSLLMVGHEVAAEVMARYPGREDGAAFRVHLADLGTAS